jgi:hypothetical protein
MSRLTLTDLMAALVRGTLGDSGSVPVGGAWTLTVATVGADTSLVVVGAVITDINVCGVPAAVPVESASPTMLFSHRKFPAVADPIAALGVADTSGTRLAAATAATIDRRSTQNTDPPSITSYR